MSSKRDNSKHNNKKYMRLALNLASQNSGLTGSNPSVGSVIVKNNNGLAYLPEWNFNGIGALSPGYGYQIKVTQSIDDFSLCGWFFEDILGY